MKANLCDPCLGGIEAEPMTISLSSISTGWKGLPKISICKAHDGFIRGVRAPLPEVQRFVSFVQHRALCGYDALTTKDPMSVSMSRATLKEALPEWFTTILKGRKA